MSEGWFLVTVVSTPTHMSIARVGSLLDFGSCISSLLAPGRHCLKPDLPYRVALYYCVRSDGEKQTSNSRYMPCTREHQQLSPSPQLNFNLTEIIWKWNLKLYHNSKFIRVMIVPHGVSFSELDKTSCGEWIHQSWVSSLCQRSESKVFIRT